MIYKVPIRRTSHVLHGDFLTRAAGSSMRLYEARSPDLLLHLRTTSRRHDCKGKNQKSEEQPYIVIFARPFHILSNKYFKPATEFASLFRLGVRFAHLRLPLKCWILPMFLRTNFSLILTSDSHVI